MKDEEFSTGQSIELQNGQTITLEPDGDNFAVGCWNSDGSNHWYKLFNTLSAARTEFLRFKDN